MKKQSERQTYMIQLIKSIDRLLAERAGHKGVILVHFQRPQLAPGERDAVCVYLAAGEREYIPYGRELESLVDDARRWVRSGVGPVPQLWQLRDGGVTLAAKSPAIAAHRAEIEGMAN